MTSELPDKFDVVVLGTGLPQSILAAAFSRIGLTVLHLDRNAYYCGDWASLGLRQIPDWIKQQESAVCYSSAVDEVLMRKLLGCGEKAFQNPEYFRMVSDVHLQYHVREEPCVKETVSSPSDQCWGSLDVISCPERGSDLECSRSAKTEICSDSSGQIDTILSPGLSNLGEFDVQVSRQDEFVALKKDVEQDELASQRDGLGQLDCVAQSGKMKNYFPEMNTSSTLHAVSKDEIMSETGVKDADDCGLDGECRCGEQDVRHAICSGYCGSDDGIRREGRSASIDDSDSGGLSSQLFCSSCGDARVASCGQCNAKSSPSKTIDCGHSGRRRWTVKKIDKEWRSFNLDLAPKVLYSSGSTVELLVVSDVAKYVEFRTVNHMLTVCDGELEKVPCSRADVFNNTGLSLLEKRLLMKFLNFAADYEQHSGEFVDYADKPFEKFLASRKLPPKLQHFLLHSVAMANEFMLTEEGLSRTKKCLCSLGRYGNSAFLYPLYGSGELPQAFCRLSAVFGGIYVLNLSVSHIVTDADNRYLVADPSYLPQTFYTIPEQRFVSRGVYVTDMAIHSGTEPEPGLSLLQVPHQGHLTSPTTLVLDLPPSAMVCPHHTNLVHMSRRSVSDNVRSDLEPAKRLLFADAERHRELACDIDADEAVKPVVLWSVEFRHRDLSLVCPSSHSPVNVHVVPLPGLDLDSDCIVEEVRKIFSVVCPGEEFLAKPPHPEDIICIDTEEVPFFGTTLDNMTPAGDGDDAGGEESGAKEA